MKLGFTATQGGLTAWQKTMARTRMVKLKPVAVVHGGCIGGDDQIDEIAAELGIIRIIFPSTHPTKALPKDHFQRRVGSVVIWNEADEPLKRNVKIVKTVDMLIGCPQQPKETVRSGTWATIRQARKVLGTARVEVINP